MNETNHKVNKATKKSSENMQNMINKMYKEVIRVKYNANEGKKTVEKAARKVTEITSKVRETQQAMVLGKILDSRY